MLTDLEGQIESITYTSGESGFTIVRLKVQGRHGTVTVVGDLMSPCIGEVLRMKGEWTDHPKYGRQFKVIHYKTEVPASVDGIIKYLGSGLIKGIGPVIARRIVKKFGKKTLSVIESEIESLAEVDGIGKNRLSMIKTAWEEHRDIRDLMLFLQTYGVGSGYAARIFKQYGKRSIQAVKENPYRLATDIFGIGFITADDIADKLGFSRNSELRAKAGILYVMRKLANDGHVYYPYESLIAKCGEILGVDRRIIIRAIGSLGAEGMVIINDLNGTNQECREKNRAVYLPVFYFSEIKTAAILKKLVHTPKMIRDVNAAKAIQWVQERLVIHLEKNQIAAIKGALENKVIVITGGPGTGKTTIINAVLKIISRIKVRALLAAPTGRAAKRMSEATGHEAVTIHRLLEFSFSRGGFRKNEENLLYCGLLIIDEASMIDQILMYHLLRAIPSGATLIIVGDVNQLPSVGAGNVLNDIIESGIVPVVELTDIFRQAKESRIIVNAHKINSGIIPDLEYRGTSGLNNDFYFIQQEEPEKVLKIIIELVKERIPLRFGFDPFDNIQVLTPMHRGIVGAQNLNAKLQAALNPWEDEIIHGNTSYRVNDKVMQIKNNYERDVFNGDIGRIVRISQADQEVIISFDGRNVLYKLSDLDEIVLAYAVSVHKSQGSEYPAVIIPVLTQHYILLQRNLIYTAVTRAQDLVVMVGTGKALAIGVNNNKTQKRYTYLKHRLLS